MSRCAPPRAAGALRPARLAVVVVASMTALCALAPLSVAMQGQASPSAPSVSSPRPLPKADLAPLDPKVAAQIREAQARAEKALAALGGSPPPARAGAKGPSAETVEAVEALGELAMLYHLYGLAEGATDLYARAAALAPGDFRWPYLSARLAQSEGEAAHAEAGYRKTLQLRPDWLPALVYLAEILATENRSEEAETFLRDALALEPKSAATRAALGQIALSRRQFQEAAGHFEAALAESPQATRLRHPLGLAYRGLGQTEKAREALASAGTVGVAPADPLLVAMESLRTGEGPHLRQGHLMIRNGRPTEAALEFRRAIEANPDSSTARIGLASALVSSGQTAEAIAQLREAVRIAPKSAVAHFNLGLLLGRQNDDREALAELETAIALDPGDAQAQGEKGRILERSGHLDEAEAAYVRAADLAPLDEEAQMAAANLLVRRERYLSARDLLLQAREMLPRSYRVTFALARLLAGAPDLAARDGAKALPLAEAAYQTRVTVATAETLAMALAELGRCAEAAEKQRVAIELAREGARGGDAGTGAAVSGLEAALALYAGGAPCRSGVPER